jgi:hypothetical protein
MVAGDLAPLVAEFTRHLSQEGYTDLTVCGLASAARHLVHWLVGGNRSRRHRSRRHWSLCATPMPMPRWAEQEAALPSLRETSAPIHRYGFR